LTIWKLDIPFNSFYPIKLINKNKSIISILVLLLPILNVYILFYKNFISI
jgi:hypothetical protein